jgi:DNA-damage-inducible protein D
MSNTSHISPFEVVRPVSDNGTEYWSARDLYKLLGYSSWQKFQFALDQAKIEPRDFAIA